LNKLKINRTMSSCPYQTSKKNTSFGEGDKKVEDSSSKCPYSNGKAKMEEEKNIKKEEKQEKKEDVSSDEDEKQTGGCPVMNKSNPKINF
jgi:hypothetical protein